MLGTLYLSKTAGEPFRTRVVLINALVKKYKLPLKISNPDNIYPSQFSAAKVPMMQWADGRLQEESIPIAIALSELVPKESGLLGDGSIETRSQILQWMCKFNYDVMAHISPAFVMKTGLKEFDQKQFDVCLKGVEAESSRLDAFLARNRFLVGDKATLADYYCCQMFLRGLQWFLGKEWREGHPHLWDWWQRVAYDDLFDGFYKQVKMVE